MELLQLRYFYESAKKESFSLTAKKYMVPTSSVSASVKRLENELGIHLFDRSSNRIQLNDKGYAFCETLEDIFKKLDTTVAAITDKAHQNVTIRILIKARRKWITELIIQYREQFPHIHFRIFHDASLLKFDDFDIVIDEHSTIYGDKENFLLSVEQICVKAAKTHPLAGQTLVFSQLKDQPFIISQREGRMWRLLENAAARCGFIPKVSIESNDKQCLLRCVEANMGLHLGSRRALEDKSEKNLVELNILDFSETQSIFVYHRTLDGSNTELGGFLAFIKLKRQAL